MESSLTLTIFFHLLVTLESASPASAVSGNEAQESQSGMSCDSVCPIGFQLDLVPNTTDCKCECDSRIFPEFVSQCFIENQTVLRRGNVWISYDNETEGFITHECIYDYCVPSSQPVYINFNIPSGEDSQCAFNRTGILCGSCQDGLSLLLGSSRCGLCSNDGLSLLILFALAGILLLVIIRVCNLAVSVGTITSLIFYANLVQANYHIFLSFDSTIARFFRVFISWLNLDFGFETCFYDGMNTYARTWLQFVFPIYIIFLVTLIHILTKYSKRFAKLFLLDYYYDMTATIAFIINAKALRIIISALSFVRLQYPDGSFETRWLVDANVPYFNARQHIPLFITTLGLFIIGTIPYTLLLLLWRPVFYRCRGVILNAYLWDRLDFFFNRYQIPFKSRYWIGLVMFAWFALYVVKLFLDSFAFPRENLLVIIFVVLCLLVFKVNFQVYYTKSRKRSLGILDDGFFVNILVLSVFTILVDGDSGQTTLALISLGIAFLGTLIVFVYHLSFVFKIFKKCLHLDEEDNVLKNLFKRRKKKTVVTFELSKRVTLGSRPVLANQSDKPLHLILEEETNNEERFTNSLLLDTTSVHLRESLLL